MHEPYSSNSDATWIGRKYNIAPEFYSSPYLSKPIGFSEPEKRKHKAKESSQQVKSTIRRRHESDVDSIVSLRTQRSLASHRSHQSYRSSQSTSVTKHMSMKNILLPREIEKLCREFRQKHSKQAVLKSQVEEQLDDDNSTICSEFAESLDDKAVYLHCHKDHELKKSLFSGPLLSDITYLNATKERSKGPIVKLPPVRMVHEKLSGDVSDLDSLHSGDQGRRSRK